MLSYILAWFIRIGSPQSGVTPHNQMVMAPVYLGALALIIPFHLMLYFYYRLYNKNIIPSGRREYKNIVKANAVCLLIVALILYLYGKRQPFYDFSRSMILLYFMFNTLFSLAVRVGIRLALRFLYSKECNQTHILLVGYSQAAEDFIDRICSNTEWGYQICGILDDHRKPGDSYRNVPVIGAISDLAEQLGGGRVNEAAITLPLGDYSMMEAVVAICEKSGVHTKFIPDYKHMIPTIPLMEDLQGLPVIHIRRLPLSNPFCRFSKRLFDLLGAVIGLTLASPVLLFTVLRIRLSSREPLMDRREWVGMHNEKFWTCEFRLPHRLPPPLPPAPAAPGIRPDSRPPAPSAAARLPLLFNVLKGDLSFVGPAPVCPPAAEQQKKDSPRYMIRFQVRPGLTGWAQVSGGLSQPLSPARQTACDLYYIENWTPLLDLKILFRAIFITIFRHQSP